MTGLLAELATTFRAHVGYENEWEPTKLEVFNQAAYLRMRQRQRPLSPIGLSAVARSIVCDYIKE